MKKYKRIQQAALFILVLFVIGLGLQAFLGGFSLGLLAYPTNVGLILGLFLLSFVATKFFFNRPWVSFLSSGAAAISALLYMGVLSLVLGITYQTKDSAYNDVAASLGLRQMTSYYPFVIAYAYLLISLSFVTFKRIKFELTVKNIGFSLNHVGLLIVLLATGLGAADKLDLRARVAEGHHIHSAISQGGQHIELPFDLELIDFSMDSYMPKLTIIDNNSRFMPEGSPVFWDVDTLASEFELSGIRFQLEEYIPYAKPMGAGYVSIANNAYVPAIKLATGNTSSWVTCGNDKVPYRMMRVNESYSLVMLKPEAKAFSSDVLISRGDKEEEANISVNKPMHIGAWSIYQSSYDDKAGEASLVSGFQLVYNPWRYATQLGLFMLILGALTLFWGYSSHKK